MTTGDAQEAARLVEETASRIVRLLYGAFTMSGGTLPHEGAEGPVRAELVYYGLARERAGLEKAASSVEGAPKGCTDFYATFVTRKEAASAIRALMVEPSEKETGR